MPTIPNNPQYQNAIKQLLQDELYVGNIGKRGFIIKRNFGVRRLPIFGEFKEDTIKISVKNEFLHQVFYVFGMLLILFLVGFTIYASQYIYSLLLIVILVLIYLEDYNRKNKEFKLFQEKIQK